MAGDKDTKELKRLYTIEARYNFIKEHLTSYSLMFPASTGMRQFSVAESTPAEFDAMIKSIMEKQHEN